MTAGNMDTRVVDAPTRFDVYRFRLLLLAMAALFVAHPLFGGSQFANAVLGPVGLLAETATLIAVSGRRWAFWTGLVLTLPTVASATGSGSGIAGLAGSGFHAPLFCFGAAVVTLRVLESERLLQGGQ